MHSIDTHILYLYDMNGKKLPEFPNRQLKLIHEIMVYNDKLTV